MAGSFKSGLDELMVCDACLFQTDSGVKEKPAFRKKAGLVIQEVSLKI
ncbi:hypothetical protein PsAD2_02220 [Pseudovibrio axinellae]|uniref:Uncharacterized protein n=1 Tax=Pseudovibrio axinellae TaxID=989403 RepID=A0A165YC39_9HYPH|nr:hypothetical protein PsAD2_02220 [Pseudovibrio axinellae]SEP96078.1 hypothetical protein SAMN05421798_101821 [Pseudovibrio axinellae]